MNIYKLLYCFLFLLTFSSCTIFKTKDQWSSFQTKEEVLNWFFEQRPNAKLIYQSDQTSKPFFEHHAQILKDKNSEEYAKYFDDELYKLESFYIFFSPDNHVLQIIDNRLKQLTLAQDVSAEFCHRFYIERKNQELSDSVYDIDLDGFKNKKKLQNLIAEGKLLRTKAIVEGLKLNPSARNNFAQKVYEQFSKDDHLFLDLPTSARKRMKRGQHNCRDGTTLFQYIMTLPEAQSADLARTILAVSVTKKAKIRSGN